MKLYTFPPAPNPARVGFYLREKGIELETVLVDFLKGEQKHAGTSGAKPCRHRPGARAR